MYVSSLPPVSLPLKQSISGEGDTTTRHGAVRLGSRASSPSSLTWERIKQRGLGNVYGWKHILCKITFPAFHSLEGEEWGLEGASAVVPRGVDGGSWGPVQGRWWCRSLMARRFLLTSHIHSSIHMTRKTRGRVWTCCGKKVGETKGKGKEKADWLFVTWGLFGWELIRNWDTVGKW